MGERAGSKGSTRVQACAGSGHRSQPKRVWSPAHPIASVRNKPKCRGTAECSVKQEKARASGPEGTRDGRYGWGQSRGAGKKRK